MSQGTSGEGGGDGPLAVAEAARAHYQPLFDTARWAQQSQLKGDKTTMDDVTSNVWYTIKDGILQNTFSLLQLFDFHPSFCNDTQLLFFLLLFPLA